MSRDDVQPLPLSDSPTVAVERGKDDLRPKMPEPPPIRLVTVEDARLIAAAGQEAQLDAFYVDILGFRKVENESALIYAAENFSLIYDICEPPFVRTDMRPLGIEVMALRETEQKLMDAEMKYQRQRGLLPGQESLLLQDPAGNWVELTERSEFR